jgi:AraC-like DNA-binding protein
MHGESYADHSHDSYAVGVTLAGVQAFRFRGERRYSLPGQVVVIHPDEPHDGSNGDEATLEYLMLYMSPRILNLVAEAEDAPAPVPFLAEAVCDSAALQRIVLTAFRGFPDRLEELAETDLVGDLCHALCRQTGSALKRPRCVDWRAVSEARDLLEGADGEKITSGQLEAATGQSRYALTRHFRAAYGASPYRYLLGRRLRRARTMIATGVGLADAAALCGFADQSHLTRHFVRRLGLTPGAFSARCRAGDIVIGV